VAAAAAAAAAAVAAGGAPGSSVGVGMVPPAAAAVGVLDRLALEDAICSVLLSLCLVMAGTGHLPTFRLVQLLSRRAAALPTRPQQAAAPEEAAPPGSAPSIAAMLGGPGLGTTSLHFGHHLAVSLAGGLLFLSGGRASLSTSNEALAALLIALYPTWPTTPTDQRCHLQVRVRVAASAPRSCSNGCALQRRCGVRAPHPWPRRTCCAVLCCAVLCCAGLCCAQAFRHLYALAAEPRCLEALDVHSRRQVVAPVHVTASTEGLLGAAACGSARSRQRPPHTQLTQQQQAQQAQQGGKGVARPAVQQQQQQQHVPAAGVLAGVQVSAVAAHTPPVKPGLAPVSPAATAGAGGGGAGQEPSGAATADAVGSVCTALTQLRLQAPCLLPERRHLVSLSVCGPRYWTVHVAAAAGAAGVRAADAAAGASSVGGGGAGSWSQQHLRQRICVKKKAGSLSYTDDTSGVRSLLFRAFYAGGSGGGALPGQAAGASAGDHGAGGADKEDAAAAGSAAGGGGSSSSSQAEQRSFDIVHLCQTFAADPQVQGFAQLLQAAGRAASGAAGSGSSGGGGMSAAVRFVTFCHSVLYECVVQEKTSMLPVYLQLYCQVLHACADAHSLQPAAGGGRMRPRAGAGLLLPRDAEGSAPLVPSTTQGSSVALQDLLTVQALYGSSTAVAAEVCRSAVDSGVAGSAAAPHGDPEPWQALLQPGFCDSLGSALLQAWRHAGVAPAHSGSSVNGGSLVEAYARLRSISAAVGAADDGVQAVLAACLAAHGGVGGGAAAL
jgi:anaphase-promoting complex subunit 1